jgi:hypothetical protein
MISIENRFVELLPIDKELGGYRHEMETGKI